MSGLYIPLHKMANQNIWISHQNPAFFFPSRYLGIFPRTIHPTKHAGVRREVFRVRDGQTADPAQQDGKRQLLPAYPRRYCQGDQTAQRNHRVFCKHCRRAASGWFWP